MSDEIIQVNPLVFGGEGESVHANMFVKLWENTNPTAAFTAQNITLASDDYDFLLWIYGTASTNPKGSVIAPKGTGSVLLSSGLTNSTHGVTNVQRTAVYVSDTEYSVSAGTLGRPSGTYSEDNTVCKPIAIYGFKKSLDVTAIVSNVSTDARQCMLSDGVTDVESKFGSVDTNIANRLPVYKAVSASNIPTGPEVSTALQSLDNKQSIVVNFYNSENTILYSSMYYCQTNVSYGAGILVSYYGSSFYKVKNANGTVTLTAF
jgi:hypothetical protein